MGPRYHGAKHIVKIFFLGYTPRSSRAMIDINLRKARSTGIAVEI